MPSIAMPAEHGPTLPNEIVDAIIDQVHALGPEMSECSAPCEASDYRVRRETLGACALTSRSWLPRSRYYLFRTVHLLPNDSDRCTAFSSLLSSPLCTLIAYVRTLIIREAYGFAGMGALWFNDALPQLSALTNVQTLAIFGARFDRIRPDHWSSAGIPFFAHMKSVTDLYLTGCQFRTPDQCLDALSVCESLENLVMRRTSLDMDLLLGFQLRLEPLPRPPLRLASLSLDSHRMGNYDAILRWIGQTPGTRHGHRDYRRRPISAATGLSLESLEFTVVDVADDYGMLDTFCHYVDLQHNTSLQSITFDQLIICEPYGGRFEMSRYVPGVLKTINSPMKEITFRVQINTPQDLDLIDWNEVISTIKGAENWTSLENIVVSGNGR
ncbi:hypothetical protein CPB85DRAFT_1255407 [Mucidula mucida]|nr:hypothetical protein CPB85DRAFT_1255407 [Mucidula mucida]